MGEGAWLVAFLVVQRLAELAIAQRNTARLRAAGGVEFGAAHYFVPTQNSERQRNPGVFRHSEF